MTLYVKSAGPDADVPVVLLHGFGATHAVWDSIQQSLAEQTMTLAYDLPGHGGSFSYEGAGPAKVATTAILADLEARDIASAHIVGHSMGGAIAALMAIFQPQRVASLTLLSPGGFGPEINQRLLKRYAAARTQAELVPSLEAMFGWFSPVPQVLVDQLMATRETPGYGTKLSEMAEGLARDGKQGMLPAEKLAALTMPVSVIWGGLDNVLPVRHTQHLPAHYALKLYPDLGHMLPDEAPDEMLKIIRQTIGLAPS